MKTIAIITDRRQIEDIIHKIYPYCTVGMTKAIRT